MLSLSLSLSLRVVTHYRLIFSIIFSVFTTVLRCLEPQITPAVSPVLSPNFLVDALGKMIAGAAKILQHHWEEALIDALNQVRSTLKENLVFLHFIS